MKKGLQNIRDKGAIPYKSKLMGLSPKIIPEDYGRTINNTKRMVREAVYTNLTSSNEDYVIIDFDLKSCYTSILLGLYPKPLEQIQKSIETVGLWEHLRKEFLAKGCIDQWNKPAVKICTYSSFFLGGNKAMTEGIMESFRLDLGLRPREFKDFKDYEHLSTIARKVVEVMQNSSVITDFRDIAQHIKESYMDDYLIGPTGHSYKVDEHSFRSAYPNYLQSYEFYLLAKATLETIKKFGQNVEVLGHYHDGNTLAVKRHLKDEVISYYSLMVKQFGQALGLHYPQDLEVKRCFMLD